MDNSYRINRCLEAGQYGLADVFADIGTYGILSAIFPDREELDRALACTRIFLVDLPHEMFVDNDEGFITIGLTHLRTAPEEFLYLDIIHELCHVRQHFQGRDLYDRTHSYVDRDTEIEAYRVTVQEARRIGLDDDAIADYLRVAWITPEDHRRLARSLNVHDSRDND